MKNRIDYVGTIAVNGANPNGDPNNGNAPRVLDGSNIGFITDVCIKHKIRMVVNEVYSDKDVNDILIVPSSVDERNLATKIASLKFDIDAIKNKYFDVRVFGAVLIDSNNSSKESSESKSKKGDKKKAMNHVRGPVSISNAFSLKPVDPIELKITRCIDQNEDNKTTFGEKHLIVDTMYKFTVTVNPRIASKSGMLPEDIDTLEFALKNLFMVDASAARPAGSMWMHSLVKVEHNSIDGSTNIKRVSDNIDADGEVITPNIDMKFTKLI